MALNLRRKLYNLTHPVVGEIWCLHRVLPERSAFRSNRELEITPEYLEQLINDRLAHGCRFVDTDTFSEQASRNRSRQKLINITFDDGFADILTYAYPILKQYSIPFTVYLTTGMPDGTADLWWLQMEQLANGDTAWFEQTIKQIYNRNNEIASTMHTLTDSAPDYTICRQLSLTWEQLGTLLSDGLCTIGSHGVSHAAMSLLTAEQAYAELLASKQRIHEQLGIEPKHFSYPHSFYNETTNQLVWQAGYNTAVIGYGGRTRYKHGNRFFYRNYIVQP